MNPTSLLTGLGAAITADPALGGANNGQRGGTPGAADLFLSLVAGLLDPTAAAATSADSTGTVTVPGQTNGQAPGQVPGQVPDGDPKDDASDTDATGADTDAGAVVTPLPTIVPPAVQAMVAAAVSPPAPSVPTDATPAGTPSTGPTATTDPTSPPAAAVAAVADPQAGADTDPAPTTLPTFTPVTGAAPASGAGGSTPVTTSAASGHHQVTGQVFPEVLRVAQGAEGTHRVTIKLNPESLGEVRVVLTSRRGGLEVSLAGGEAARRALTEGAPELHRLLESVGRTESRIVIRDLPAVVAPSPAARPDASSNLSSGLSGGQLGGQDGAQHGGQYGGPAGGPSGEGPAHREAPRHPSSGSTTATDGTPTATSPSRRTETITRGRSGLDVTM